MKKTAIVPRIISVSLGIPTLVIILLDFTGNTVHEAFRNAFESFYDFPEAWITIGLLLFMNFLILLFINPIIRFWKCEDKCRTMSLKNHAMRRINKLNSIIIGVCVAGFVLGYSIDIVKGDADGSKFLIFFNFFEGFTLGLFSGMLIIMSQEHILFPVKRALMMNPPEVPQRYYSFYKRLVLSIAALIFFLITQMFELTSEFLTYGIEMKPVANILNSSAPAIFEISVHDHQLRQIVQVFLIRIGFFVILSFRLVMLLKVSLRNPLNTVQERLEDLTSESSKTSRKIAIVNNDEFSEIYTEINKLIIKQETEIDQGKRRLRKVVDSAADPILSFDENGKIFMYNPAAEKLFQWKRCDIEGHSITCLFDQFASKLDTLPESCGDSMEKFNELILNHGRPKRIAGYSKSGEEINFEVNISSSETPKGLIYTAVFRDISQQIVFEETLKAAKISAENANQLKSEFLANMSHELRTPLNAVLGFTQLLKNDKNLTKEQLKKINIISRSGEHLLALINDILDISKIEAGKIELHTTTFNLREFTEDLKEMFDLRCKKKGLALYVEYVDPLPKYIQEDLGKLRQIMINILGNAIKFTDDGGISILVGVENNRLGISVTDTGKGIPEDEIDTILHPFMQSTNTDNEGGTGLGLAITNSYIEMMGGKLTIESEIEKGSTFRFDLPLNIVDAPEQEEDEIGIVVAVKDYAHPKVLIVDDKENNRLILKEMLERVGFITMEAADGREAITNAYEFDPEIIFMDIKMPVMDGYESVTQIKSDDKLKDIAVFALTASAFKHDEKRIFDSGFNGFLAKPFKQSALFQLIFDNTEIDFIYEERSEEKLETIDLNQIDFSEDKYSVSEEFLIKLGELIVINDFISIKSLAAELDSSKNELVSVIDYLAENFDEERMQILLNKLKERR